MSRRPGARLPVDPKLARTIERAEAAQRQGRGTGWCYTVQEAGRDIEVARLGLLNEECAVRVYRLTGVWPWWARPALAREPGLAARVAPRAARERQAYLEGLTPERRRAEVAAVDAAETEQAERLAAALAALGRAARTRARDGGEGDGG